MGAIVNSNKKYFYSFAILISLIATSLIISAAGVNTNIGWHPIQQVSTDDTGFKHLDQNYNHIVDEADYAHNAGAVSWNDILNMPACFADGIDNEGSGGTGGTCSWLTSGSNIYYNSGNVGIGTANPSEKLTVLEMY